MRGSTAATERESVLASRALHDGLRRALAEHGFAARSSRVTASVRSVRGCRRGQLLGGQDLIDGFMAGAEVATEVTVVGGTAGRGGTA